MPLVRSPESALDNLVKAFTPSIKYNERMIEYEQQCEKHGLERKSGIRLWITNETQTDESFDVSYEDNIFQSAIDGLQQLLQPIRQIGRSTSSGLIFGDEKIDKLIGPTIERGENIFGQGIVGAYGLYNPDTENDPAFKTKVTKILDNVGELTKILAEVVVKGNRITMPKIWQNTTYGQNFSVTIKLSSPYGTPAAITKYIVRPLLYLLILASPKTEDGISFGDNHPIAIRAYGLGWYKLGAIKSLTVRRGGGDGMFNLYRQPLTADVTITFQNLIDGFAVFAPKGDKIDLLSRANTSIGQSVPSDTSERALMTDIRTFVDSFRPLAGQDNIPQWQDYKENMGRFTKGRRSRYPYANEKGLNIQSKLGTGTPISTTDQAIRIVQEAAPDLNIPEDITIRELIQLVETIRNTDLKQVYEDIKSQLYSLVTGTVASVEQALLDYVRATAVDTINTVATKVTDIAEENVLKPLADKMPSFSDFNPVSSV